MATAKSALKRVLGRGTWERLRMRYWLLLRSAAIDHSALALPWQADSGVPELDALHRLARELDWVYARTLEARLVLWLASAGWPVWSLGPILSALLSEGPNARAQQGRSLVRQFADLVALANRHNLPPASYYKFRLFGPMRHRPVRAWINHYEICNLLPFLNEGRDTGVLNDKVSFFERCRALGLPAAPVIAAFDAGGRTTWYSAPAGELPDCDLVVKCADLSCGVRFERWTREPGGAGWTRGGERLDAQAFVGRCSRMAEERLHLVQPRLRNHPVIAPLAGEGLCTVRAVTYITESGSADLLQAVFRMPAGGNLVDNFAAGGLAAPIERATGVLGPAVTKRPGPALSAHPDTGARITGTVLPCWPEALDLARRAQAAFAEVPFVGWDIVLTSAGPILLEANPTWCVDLLQIPHGRPLGETVFPQAFARHQRASGRQTPEGGREGL
jgi:hypothetical protein